MPRPDTSPAMERALATIDALPRRSNTPLRKMDIGLVSRLLSDYRAELRDPRHEPGWGDAKWRLRRHFEAYGIALDFDIDAVLYGNGRAA